MANAPYEVNVSGTDDETFMFVLPFENADGTPFPFNQYELEYSLRKEGSTRLHLTQGQGITVEASSVTFDGGSSLRRGEYAHGCRIKHIETGRISQVFDGTVTIGEGNF